jgi:hypothetical protein
MRLPPQALFSPQAKQSGADCEARHKTSGIRHVDRMDVHPDPRSNLFEFKNHALDG